MPCEIIIHLISAHQAVITVTTEQVKGWNPTKRFREKHHVGDLGLLQSPLVQDQRLKLLFRRLQEQSRALVSGFLTMEVGIWRKTPQQRLWASREHRIVKYDLEHLQVNTEAPPFLLGMGCSFSFLPCPLCFAR